MNDFELPARGLRARPPQVRGYDVGRLLGRGGTADVWLATDQVTGRAVALKCFHGGPAGEPPSSDAEGVRREVRILSALDHEHLVKVHDVVAARYGSTGGGLALVLDYAPGGSLAGLVAARGCLGPGETVTVLTPIAQLLGYLHGQGFTHGDVSPGNVLFTAQGKPLLADLGVGRMLADPGDPSCAGTDGFRDPAPVDAVRAGLQPESDVYSAAALGWFCLTGRAPEPESQRPPLPLLVPDVPPALTEALEAGLRLDRRQRPSAAELAAAVFRSFPPAPVDLSASADPAVLPQLPTRRSLPATARERRAARRRDWRRRFARRRGPFRIARALVLVILATAGLVAGSLLSRPAAAPEPEAPTATTAPAAPAAAGPGAVPSDLEELLAADQPEEAVRGLAGLRSYAFSTGQLGLLEQVTVPASPAAVADAAVASPLAASGHVLDGYEARLSVVERRPESTAERAVVWLSVATPAYRERDAAGAVVAEAPAVPEQRLRLVLARVDGRWRIQEILPGAPAGG